MTEPPTTPCCACGQPLTACWQPGLAHPEGFWLITCDNPTCALYAFTFAGHDYPPRDLARYLKRPRTAAALAG